MPRVSVILPSRNRRTVLPRAIASVLNQSFDDLELVVIDDASDDGTIEYLEAIKDERLVIVRSANSAGVGAARNLAIRHASGEYLAFQDSDDEWLPHKLALQVQAMDALPSDHAVLGSRLLRLCGTAVESVIWPLLEAGRPAPVDRDRLLCAHTAYLQSMLIRRDAFNAVGGFDETLATSSDWELCLRLLRDRYRFAALPQTTAISYETPNSLSRQDPLRCRSMRQILATHRTLLEECPRALASYHYALALVEFRTRQSAAARGSSWSAVRGHPACLRYWLLALAGLFGHRGVTLLTGLKQRIRRRGRWLTW